MQLVDTYILTHVPSHVLPAETREGDWKKIGISAGRSQKPSKRLPRPHLRSEPSLAVPTYARMLYQNNVWKKGNNDSGKREKWTPGNQKDYVTDHLRIISQAIALNEALRRETRSFREACRAWGYRLESIRLSLSWGYPLGNRVFVCPCLGGILLGIVCLSVLVLGVSSWESSVRLFVCPFLGGILLGIVCSSVRLSLSWGYPLGNRLFVCSPFVVLFGLSY
ncbi:hypothetical protein FPQ18DRAFT_64335 [Pyronema domesticum]|nr:hypothetical protein FPQ18DRAFT_64335 [Pyronema domesticum]